MSDFYYTKLHAKFAGFRIMVLANRLACNDDLSRVAHDTLVGKLDELIDLARATVAAECKLAQNPDSPEAEDLGEQIWAAGQDLTYLWREPDGIDLLHCDVCVDWATKEWYNKRTGEWRFLDGFPPPRIKIGDDRLNGLCKILGQIAKETGIVFNTYTTKQYFGVEEPDEDPECYVALHGSAH
ncbi:hypothetical protein [Neoaquamicrobium sediminum]|uniref:hypothetical protein n=1 Tax=Neoaquamicrobium sediminum TaxID=1849104 RepID=UPI001563E077|nr:hypothetical protein [Mesorhizobium sediminum]NRC57287.1 hypothetical protein [Mesorhizobium sediminum]